MSIVQSKRFKTDDIILMVMILMVNVIKSMSKPGKKKTLTKKEVVNTQFF